MNELTKNFFDKLKQSSDKANLQFPPPAIRDLDPTLLEHIPGRSTKWSYPIKERYNNPFRITFGGYYACFFDAAFGPFSGVTTGKPTTSLDLNITFLKPLSVQDEVVIVDVEVISQSKSYLILSAKAHSGRGVLVATCTSRMLILNR